MRVWLIALLFACSSRQPQPLGPQVSTSKSTPPTPTQVATPAPATPYAQLEALMPKAIAALTELGDSLRDAKGDCTKLAKVLRGFADKHAAMLPDLAALMGKLSDQERQRFELEHHDDRERLDKLFAATKFDCPGNAEVEAALVTAGFRRK